MHISTLWAETGLSLHLRTKNASSVIVDIQTDAVSGLSLEGGRQLCAQSAECRNVH
jgi:hypothetical protein